MLSGDPECSDTKCENVRLNLRGVLQRAFDVDHTVAHMRRRTHVYAYVSMYTDAGAYVHVSHAHVHALDRACRAHPVHSASKKIDTKTGRSRP